MTPLTDRNANAMSVQVDRDTDLADVSRTAALSSSPDGLAENTAGVAKLYISRLALQSYIYVLV